jgi:uncharacterized phage-associated protein
MPLDANVIANQFLDRGLSDTTPIQPMKLQKLIYLAHGWHLFFLNAPLISQDIEAWKYGPVIPEVYSEFREFKGNPITRLATVPPTSLMPTEIQQRLLDNVWRTYKDKGSIYLSMLTHESGSAWEITRRNCNSWYSPVIPNDLIRAEFAKRKRDAETS